MNLIEFFLCGHHPVPTHAVAAAEKSELALNECVKVKITLWLFGKCSVREFGKLFHEIHIPWI